MAARISYGWVMIWEYLSCVVETVIIFDSDEWIPCSTCIKPSVKDVILDPRASLKANQAFWSDKFIRVAWRLKVSITFLFHSKH